MPLRCDPVAVQSEPSYTVLCHRDSCRCAAGSPVVAWASFPVAWFPIGDDLPAYRRYPGARVR